MDLTTAVILASEGGESELKLFFFHSLSEMLTTAIASIIVFALLWWKGMPAAKSMLQGRTDRIAGEIEGADQARRDGESRLAQASQRVSDAENERQHILVEARQTAEALKAQIVARAEAEAEAIVVRSGSDIEAAKNQAIADLQAEVAELALGAAQAVVAASLDADTQSDLIDGYIEQVGGAGGAAESVRSPR
jgi:F-type H+-transporting ATPase subunit b